MAENEKTSKRMASEASKILREQKSFSDRQECCWICPHSSARPCGETSCGYHQ